MGLANVLQILLDSERLHGVKYDLRLCNRHFYQALQVTIIVLQKEQTDNYSRTSESVLDAACNDHRFRTRYLEGGRPC